MKSDSYYRDLVVDVLCEVPPTMTSPALSEARWAVDDELGRPTSPDYWRELLVDVLGELPPGPESMPIEVAREAVELELEQRRRASPIELDAELSREARRVLAHVRAGTEVGKFASGLHDMPEESWRRAVDELRSAGYRVDWTIGQVADDRAVTGGFVFLKGRERTQLPEGCERRGGVCDCGARPSAVAPRARDSRSRDLTRDDGLELEL